MSFGYCIFTFEGGDWSHDDFAGLERGFKEAKRLGFDYVEVPSYVLPDRPRTDAAVLNRLERILELSERFEVPLSAIFASANLLDSDSRSSEIYGLTAIARMASTANVKFLPVTIGIRQEDQGVDSARELARITSDVADKIAPFGVELVIHPHIEGPLERPGQIDAFFEDADTRVGMCLDVGHIIAGGGDPFEVLDKHAARVRYVHLKDLDPEAYRRASGEAKYAAFRDPGQGPFDFQRFVQQLKKDGFTGPILAENDLSENPVASIEAAAEYRKVLGL